MTKTRLELRGEEKKHWKAGQIYMFLGLVFFLMIPTIGITPDFSPPSQLAEISTIGLTFLMLVCFLLGVVHIERSARARKAAKNLFSKTYK